MEPVYPETRYNRAYVDTPAPTISIIIPAHNEEALLGVTLDALGAAGRALGEMVEIVVVDDASTDRTAAVARERGAQVVPVNVRQIGAARNAGARVARGSLLVFVDADTTVPPAVLEATVAAIRDGAVGGGAMVEFDAGAPPWAKRALVATCWILKTARWAAGCYVFATREAFERAGGFDERFFASEEIHLSRALKRIGRFVIIPAPVTTSGRKADAYSLRHTLWMTAALVVRPGSLKRRDRLEYWYDWRP